jgi:hypothetical protein
MLLIFSKDHDIKMFLYNSIINHRNHFVLINYIIYKTNFIDYMFYLTFNKFYNFNKEKSIIFKKFIFKNI